MDLTQVAAFAALTFALIVVPGPSVMFVVSRAVALGRKAALLTVIGNSAGVYTQILLVALGLGVIVERSIAVFTVVKVAGALYLVWLGIRAIRHRSSLRAALKDEHAYGSATRILGEGFIVGVTNPKAIVFFAAILPQFVTPGGAPAGIQMALLGVVAMVIALISDSLWGLAAGTARTWFAGSSRRLERLSAAGGVVMVVLGLQLALTGRKD